MDYVASIFRLFEINHNGGHAFPGRSMESSATEKTEQTVMRYYKKSYGLWSMGGKVSIHADERLFGSYNEVE
jgi:hypothetical protein